MAEYQIMTDATADLPEELADELGVTVIPMALDMGGQSYLFGPKGGTIGVDEFYRRLADGEVARTSQINALVYNQYFEEVLRRGEDVVIICLSSGLSASAGMAVTCAAKLMQEYPERKIYCIDSLCAACGEGLLTYAAVQKKRQGLSAGELAAWLEGNKLNMAHWVTVDELSYLRRGGRVSAASATVGTMLSIKPIIHVNREGKLIAVNKVRGRRKSLEFLARALRENLVGGPNEPVFIGYGTTVEDAELLRELILADRGGLDVRLHQIGPIIGAHTGPSVVAAFFFGDKK